MPCDALEEAVHEVLARLLAVADGRRPASSCALIHSSVASRLASSSASPSARHCGHSLSVSASQAGLGRLPAMAVRNMDVS